MKVRAWWCPSCGSEKPLTHLVNEGGSDYCSNPCLPPDDAANMLAEVEEDTTHVFGAITSTRLLNCPRAIAIEDCIPMALDPLRYMRMHDGTDKHKALARRRPNGVRREVKVRGKLWGYEVSATIDRLGSMGIIEYKTTGKAKSKSGGPTVWPGQHVQVSIQWHLAPEPKPASIRIWYKHWIGGLWSYADVEPLSLDEIASYKPAQGKFTVREHAEQLNSFYKRVDALAMEQRGPACEAIIRGMPLAGRDMTYGKDRVCDGCLAQRECDRLEGIVSL